MAAQAGSAEQQPRKFPQWTNADLWAEDGISTLTAEKKNLLQLTAIKSQLKQHHDKRAQDRDEERRKLEEWELAQKQQQRQTSSSSDKKSSKRQKSHPPPAQPEQKLEAPDELVALNDFVEVAASPAVSRSQSRMGTPGGTTATASAAAAAAAESGSAAESSAPWARGSGYSQHSSPLLRLHEEMLDFCAYVCPSKEEQVRRNELIVQIRQICRSIWPKSKLYVFGSMATGLYLPGSDIDLVLFGAEGTNHMQKLARRLKKNMGLAFMEVIAGARVPIIKFTDTVSNLQVDICFDQRSGLDSARYIVQTLARMPALRPLTLILKCFLTCRDLNEPYKGGVGSFMLQLMIIAHLQMFSARNAVRWEDPESHPNLGSLLLSFFQFYGLELNYINVGVSVRRNGSLFDKRSKNFFRPDRPYMLSLENPLQPELDVGVSSYAIGKVRRAFVFAYHQLLRDSEVHSLGGPLFTQLPQNQGDKAKTKAKAKAGGKRKRGARDEDSSDSEDEEPGERYQKRRKGKQDELVADADADPAQDDAAIARANNYYNGLGLLHNVEEAPTLLSRILSMPYMD